MLAQDQATVVQDAAPVEQIKQRLRAGHRLPLPDQFVKVLVQSIDVAGGDKHEQRRVLCAQLGQPLVYLLYRPHG